MKTIFLFLFCVFTPLAASAGEAPSFYLEDLTWPEVKERMLTGTDTIIIPSGGTEQNGPHIAIGKHNWIVRYTSGEIAKQLGNALAAPVIAYVPEGRIAPADGHMRFPGTISLREDAFALILEDAARSFKQHGFKHICFIGDHGGNQNAQAIVAEKLGKEWKSEGVSVLSVSDYYTDQGAVDWVAAKKLGVENAVAHAGFMDAAEIMALNPNGLRPALIKHYTKDDFETNGTMGDPSAATAEYGKILLALKVKAAVEQIQKSIQP